MNESLPKRSICHCEEQSDEAITKNVSKNIRDCFASARNDWFSVFWSRLKNNKKSFCNFALFSLVFCFVIIFASCNKKEPEKFFGKWKVEEVGLKGLDIIYEFKKDTIIIESIFDKRLSDSLGEPSSRLIKENYFIKSDTGGIYTLVVINTSSNDSGQYILSLEDSRMLLTDFQNEKIYLKKINSTN